MDNDSNNDGKKTQRIAWNTMDGYDNFVSVCVANGCRSKFNEGDWRNTKINCYSHIPVACNSCTKDDITVCIHINIRVIAQTNVK